MKRVFTYLVSKHSIIFLVFLMLICDLFLITNIFLPNLIAFIKRNNIFEILVLMTLVEVLLLLSSQLWKVTALVYDNDREAQEIINSHLREDNSIRTIKIISAGLGTRYDLVKNILKKHQNISIELVACFGEGHPNHDATDCLDIGPNKFQLIDERLKEQVPDAEKRLKIYNSFNSPSLRVLILCDKYGPKYGQLSWYRFYDRNTKITGESNKQFYVFRNTEFGFPLLKFAEEMFNEYSSIKESEKIWPI